jgi:hypothetical protein
VVASVGRSIEGSAELFEDEVTAFATRTILDVRALMTLCVFLEDRPEARTRDTVSDG